MNGEFSSHWLRLKGIIDKSGLTINSFAKKYRIEQCRKALPYSERQKQHKPQTRRNHPQCLSRVLGFVDIVWDGLRFGGIRYIGDSDLRYSPRIANGQIRAQDSHIEIRCRQCPMRFAIPELRPRCAEIYARRHSVAQPHLSADAAARQTIFYRNATLYRSLHRYRFRQISIRALQVHHELSGGQQEYAFIRHRGGMEYCRNRGATKDGEAMNFC